MPVYAVLPSRYPGADPTVFVGTAEGLFKSTDAGRTFQPTPVSGVAVTRIEWPGPDLVLATANGVLVSPDGGQTIRSGVGLPAGPVPRCALVLLRGGPGALRGDEPGHVPVLGWREDMGSRGASGPRRPRPRLARPDPLRGGRTKACFVARVREQTWAAHGRRPWEADPRRLPLPARPRLPAPRPSWRTDREPSLRTGNGGERWLTQQAHSREPVTVPAVPAARAHTGQEEEIATARRTIPAASPRRHGYGNGFLLVEEKDAPADLSDWARRALRWNRGPGGDGVLLVSRRAGARAGCACGSINSRRGRGRDLGQRAALPGRVHGLRRAMAAPPQHRADEHRARVPSGWKNGMAGRASGSATDLGAPILESDRRSPRPSRPPRPRGDRPPDRSGRRDG